MTVISNSYSSNHAAATSTKPSSETKTQEKEEGLWESFCNEVIAPVLEDAAYDYLDDNFGTNLAEQKEQKELEQTYEEVLAEDEAKSNQSLLEGLGEVTGEFVTDTMSKYLDENLGTNINQDLKEKKEKDAALLEEAKAYKAQKEAQEPQTGGIYDFLCSLFKLKA